MDPQTQNDIAKLSDADRKELTQFLENEAQRSNIQQIFGSLNIFTDSASGQRFTTSPMSAGRSASLERFPQAVWVRERRAAHKTVSNDGWTRTSPSSNTWKLFEEGNDFISINEEFCKIQYTPQKSWQHMFDAM
ncbi:uncharacterized protein CDV56_105389 [Aspergillus thermomutatus]|uniref:Uncharacterized protein n=1 Tax=Aspergillus thermomutatus TaxID=41047 RepID=A0A397GGW7_ASPTH|nr:uncharacterized protein CDV56_105389 [Aspergillus thermomutatus]RHZ50252.1 hypothetical protein CDV56_105389 [Aspergillus thermomutatus]